MQSEFSLEKEDFNGRINTLKKQLLMESEQTLLWKSRANDKYLDLLAEITSLKAELSAKSLYITELRTQLDTFRREVNLGNYSIEVNESSRIKNEFVEI